MDPSSTANRHDMLGPGDCAPTTRQVRGWEPENSRALNKVPAPRDDADDGDDDVPHYSYSSGGGAATVDTAGHDRARRGDVAAGTEIGAPDGRIPTGRDVRAQLAAARDSQLPVGPSRTAGTHPHPDHPPAAASGSAVPGPGPLEIPLGSRAHRNSNYAPGYEGASDAVPHKTYSEAGHSAMVLPHEELSSVGSGTHTRDFS